MKNEPKWLWEGRPVSWETLPTVIRRQMEPRLTRYAYQTRMVELMAEWLDDKGQEWLKSIPKEQITTSLLRLRAAEVFGWGPGKKFPCYRPLSRSQSLGSFGSLLGDL